MTFIRAQSLFATGCGLLGTGKSLSFVRPLKMHGNIQRFWALGEEGNRAYLAYEHIDSYVEGSLVQYGRIFDLWKQSSAIPESAAGAFEAKRLAMHQVIRDIHFLLVSKQAIWRAVATLCSVELYPKFQHLVPLKKSWHPYFEQFREPRNSFEHFEDQILGKDTRKNSPGYGVRLTPEGEFSLGSQQPVVLGAASKRQLEQFQNEFKTLIHRGL
jgi:hypothetical protein